MIKAVVRGLYDNEVRPELYKPQSFYDDNHMRNYMRKAIRETDDIVFLGIFNEDESELLHHTGCSDEYDKSRQKGFAQSDNLNNFDAPPEGTRGFVYMTFIDGKYYIGQKNFHSYSKGKRGKESNWRTYCGSSNDLTDAIRKSPNEPTRVILRLCAMKSEMNYYEIAYQVEHNAIMDPNCFNKQLGNTHIHHSEKWLPH